MSWKILNRYEELLQAVDTHQHQEDLRWIWSKLSGLLKLLNQSVLIEQEELDLFGQQCS